MSEYKLYVLVAREADAEGQDSHSPFALRTAVDLALLGVPYERVPLTFAGIRGDLAKETGNDKVTVPTLKTKDGYVTDSRKIADYLNKKHGTPATDLFTGDAESLMTWVDTEIAMALCHLLRPVFLTLHDAPSAHYFLTTKCDNDEAGMCDIVDLLRNPARRAEAEASTQAAREKLAHADRILAQGPYLHGAHPGHADSALFGWYLGSQAAAPAINELLWEHPDVPHVTAWAARMKDKTGLTVKFVPA